MATTTVTTRTHDSDVINHDTAFPAAIIAPGARMQPYHVC